MASDAPQAPSERARTLAAYAFLTAAAILWSGNSVAGRAMIDSASPATLAFWRWALALPILAPFVIGELRRHAAILRRDWKWFMLFGLLAGAPNHVIVYDALQYTTAINVQLFNSTIPAWVILIQWTALATRPARAEVAGLCVSLAGVFVIATGGELARLVALEFNRGDLLILGCFITWSLYAVLLRFRAQALSASAFVFVVALCGVLWVSPLFALEIANGYPLPREPKVWAGLAFTVIGASIFASIFHSAGTDRVGAARASLFLHLIPVSGAVLATLILGESFQGFHAAGFALVLAGLWIARVRPGRA